MSRLPLEIHPEADEEYLASIWWYRERSPDTAESFVHAVRRGFEKIEASPRRWPVYLPDFRKYRVYGFPYSIVYVIEPSRVFVLAIAHGSRRPGHWRDRV
jgi:toxin ParE1/3/4